KSDAPGVRRKITVQDLPPPTSNILAINRARVVNRPAGVPLRVPPGFKIELYAEGFRDPRFLLTAPNGDIFVVESRANQIKVLRDTNGDGKPDGKKMYVSIGSRSNVSDNAAEADRARIFEFNPDGTNRKVYAWGIRNAVGIAFRPGSNELWMSTNERDEIGEDLPPDYISSVRPGGFYGWPWFYIGNHPDPRHKGK